MRRIAALALPLVLFACAPEAPPPPERADAPPGGEPDPGRIVSVVPATEPRTLQIQVRAPTDQALFLDNCGGAFPWGLEHRVAGVWEPAWLAVMNECHSAPLEIAPGEARVLTGTIRLGPGEALPADSYRVALYGLFTRHDQPNHMDNPQLSSELSASEPFALGPLAPI